MKSSTLTFEQRYSDDSGVEFGVRYAAEAVSAHGGHPGTVTLESIDTICIPVEQLDWYIEALTIIRDHVKEATDV